MQLPLGIKLPDNATFTNLITGKNGEAIDHVKQSIAAHLEDHSAIYLWGLPGSGKSHILQAACQAVSNDRSTAVYLSLKQLTDTGEPLFDPGILQGLESIDLVCIDDIDAVAGHTDWEEALFHLYNRIQIANSRIFIAGNSAPVNLNIILADLRSRLAGGWVFQLQLLSDEEKKQALQLRAHTRGIVMPNEVSDYLLRYFPRDMHALFSLLDQLDTASMVEQRRLTIPFVKNVLLN